MGSVREMLPSDFTKGLAWWGRDAKYGNRSGDSWEHGGYMAGVRTHMYLYPDRSEGIVILPNGEVNYSCIQIALQNLLHLSVDDCYETRWKRLRNYLSPRWPCKWRSQ